MSDEQAYLKVVPQFSAKEADLLTRAVTDRKAEKRACDLIWRKAAEIKRAWMQQQEIST